MDASIPEAERIERAALIDLHEAAGEDLRSSLGLRLERHGGAVGALMSRLADRPDWHVYLSLDERGNLAGACAMFVRDRIAWFSYAATLPTYRGRGGQGGMLVRRIRDAIDLGVRLMVTETGTALEDEPQHSYRNIERAGFQRTYVRENWILPAGWPGIIPASTP